MRKRSEEDFSGRQFVLQLLGGFADAKRAFGQLREGRGRYFGTGLVNLVSKGGTIAYYENLARCANRANGAGSRSLSCGSALLNEHLN
jgi:hypothetical protein